MSEYLEAKRNLNALIPMHNYFETLSDALDEASARLEKARGVLADPAWRSDFCNEGPVNYGQTRARSFALASLKGNGTRKGFHVTIYRLESGRYELTTYIL